MKHLFALADFEQLGCLANHHSMELSSSITSADFVGGDNNEAQSMSAGLVDLSAWGEGLGEPTGNSFDLQPP